MAIRTKYFVLANSGGNHTDFDLDYGSVSLTNENISFVGSSLVDSVFIRPGVSIDFTLSGIGADKIYLAGNFSSYSRSLSGSVMTLQRGGGNNSESVSFIKASTSAGSDVLIFSDGVVNSLDLFNNLKSSVPLPAISLTETSLARTGPGAHGASLSAKVKAFALDSAGNTFASPSPGVALTVVGGSGVDTVYAKEGSQIDATLLGLGKDFIYFSGAWQDYSKSVGGSVITFSRAVNGSSELIKVVAGNGSLNDQLVFADGGVGSLAVKTALLLNSNCSISAVTDYSASLITPGLRPTLLASALDNVNNLDVTSNIVLNYSSAVTAQPGKYIRIWNDGGNGFHSENVDNDLSILVTDTTQVTVDSSGKVTINPLLDLDFANNYHITIDAGAFAAKSNSALTADYDGTSTLNFSTVTPGNVSGIPGASAANLAYAAASQVMNADGTISLSSGHLWLDLEGLGDYYTGSGTVVPLDLSGAKYSLVFKDYQTSLVPALGEVNDGIVSPNFYVGVTGFGGDDLIYIDNQTSEANNLLNTQIIANEVDGVVLPTIVTFFGATEGVGGWFNLSLAQGSNQLNFGTFEELKTALSVNKDPVLTNTHLDMTAPLFSSAYTSTDGTKIILSFNEMLSTTTAATSQFTVNVNGGAAVINSVAVANERIELTLASPVSIGQSITVKYLDPTIVNNANAVQDRSGNDAVSIVTTSVSNLVPDTTAPAYLSAATSADGTKVVLTYNETLSATTAALAQFAVQVAGATRSISSVAVSGSTVQLTLSSAITYGQSVTVAYSDPSASNDTSALQDASGNDAATLAATAVTNAVIDVTAPTFISASSSSDGNKVILTYNEELSSSTAPSSRFTVSVAGVSRTVNSVAVNGSTVELTLASPILANQALTVTYTDPSTSNDANALQDVAGNDALTLASTPVTNTVADTLAPTFVSAETSTDGTKVILTYN